MKELSEEVCEDIVKSFKILMAFSKLNESTKVPLDIFNYQSLNTSTFIDDWEMLQAVSSSIVTDASGFISDNELTDGRYIIGIFEDNCYDDLVFQMHGEYLDTLTLNELNAIWSEEEEEYLIDEGFIYYLSCLGMRCLSVRIPFVTELNEITSKFLAYIPYLLQWEYNLSSCFFIKSHVEMNTEFNCVQVYVYYIPSDEGDFLDAMRMDSLYDYFTDCIKDEMIRRKIVYFCV